MRRNCLTDLIIAAAAFWCGTAFAQSHLVVGQGPPAGTPFKLFTSGSLNGASGHGPSIAAGSIQPIVRINLVSSYAQPRFGGYSFSTAGFSDLGLDYAASPYNLDINLLPGPPANFSVRLKRLAYSLPSEFSVYNPSGTPQMVENENEYAYGTAGNGGHVHPLWLMRRPGLMRWDMQFTSDQWINSDPYFFYFTTVPGRGTFVPLNLSGLFNADVVDSDGADTPSSFDSAGNSWVLNGNYGTTSGLPASGQLGGFQLVGLAGSSNNCLFDNGTQSLASTLDLQAGGQADSYLSVEFLVGGAGSFTTADSIGVTFTYTDNSTKAIAIQQGSAAWLPYRPIDTWQQGATPRPWTAVGRSGDRTLGFARSTGAAIDVAAGESFFLFRACSPLDSTKTLKSISFADYTGSNRVGIFAILAIKKAPLVIATNSLPAAHEGQPYSFAVTADGTPPFKNWAATGLPGGLTIDTSSGAISGTPAAGTAAESPHLINLSCNDSINDFDVSYPIETANRTLSLVILPGSVPGDIDGNGVVNGADVTLFVRVLAGLETNATYVQRSDINGDTIANGRDVQPFVALMP